MTWTLVALSAAAIALAGTAVSAELPKEGEIDGISCFAGETSVIAHSKNHVALGFNITGTFRSNVLGAPLGDISSAQCIGILSILEGEQSVNGFCEYVGAEGDRTFSNFTRTGGTTGNWQYLNGTGKLAGITGGGLYEIMNFPTIRPGTFQGCNHATGTYKLP